MKYRKFYYDDLEKENKELKQEIKNLANKLDNEKKHNREVKILLANLEEEKQKHIYEAQNLLDKLKKEKKELKEEIQYLLNKLENEKEQHEDKVKVLSDKLEEEKKKHNKEIQNLLENNEIDKHNESNIQSDQLKKIMEQNQEIKSQWDINTIIGYVLLFAIIFLSFYFYVTNFLTSIAIILISTNYNKKILEIIMTNLTHLKVEYLHIKQRYQEENNLEQNSRSRNDSSGSLPFPPFENSRSSFDESH